MVLHKVNNRYLINPLVSTIRKMEFMQKYIVSVKDEARDIIEKYSELLLTEVLNKMKR